MALSTEQLNKLKELHLKKTAVTQEQPATDTQMTTQPTDTRGFLDKAKDFVGGAVYGLSAPGRAIQNTLSSGVDKVFGTQDFGKATKQGFEQGTGTDLNTTSAKIGEFAGETIPYLAQPGAGAVKGLTGYAGRAALDTAIGTAQTGDLKQGATIGVGGQLLSFGGKILQQAGRGIYKASIPLSAKEAKLVQNYKANNTLTERLSSFLKGDSKAPITNKETAFSKGLAGTEEMIGVQGTRAKKEIWNKVIDPALKNSQVKVDMQDFFSEVQENIIKNNSDLTRQKALLNALDAIKEDYAGVDIVSAGQLQKYKEGWAKFVPDKAYKGGDISGSVKEVQNELASLARNKIYEAVDDPAVKRAYLDYGNLGNLQEWGQKAMAGSRIKGGTGTSISSLVDMVVVPVGTIGGRTIYRTGSGIEVVGNAGAKTINDIINQSEKEQN